MTKLENKIVVLTGAGGGIGSAIAEKLAEEKMFLILLGGHNREKLELVARKIDVHSSSLILPGDLTDPAFITESLGKIKERFGRIDVLINNAGIAQNTPFEEVTLEEFDRIMAINVRAPFILTRGSLPLLRSAGEPVIINIASIVSHHGYPQQSIYSASKHALLGMTKSLARELYKENIRVHVIAPGGVYTDMVKISRPDLTPEGMILPEDVANIVHFFLSCRSSNAVIDEILLHRMNKEPFA